MSSPLASEADRKDRGSLLNSRKLRVTAVLLLIAVAIGAFLYAKGAGREAAAVKKRSRSARFADEFKFGPDEQVMYTLTHIGGEGAAAAVEKIVEEGNKEFIPVFIEMLDAAETQPIVLRIAAHRHIFALRKLVDDPKQNVQDIDSLARQWQTWYAGSEIGAPDGFTAWKGKLYGRIDQRFEDFFQNEFTARIRTAEIVYGGVKVDEIPSLDSPPMLPADNADYMDPGEPVLGIMVNGDARAYPQRILEWHEIVNDSIGGIAVALTYCPLSSAGIAYDARANDGSTYTFGTSGLVYRSNKLMYDRETETLWNQFTGTPALGKLSSTDVALKRVPVTLATWQSWRAAHPQTTVLDVKTGFERRYEPAAAYGDYCSSDRIMFAIAPVKDALPPKIHVFGIHNANAEKAFPVHAIAEQKVVNDSVGTEPVVLIAPEGTITVQGTARRRGETQKVAYDAGGPIRAYERGNTTFKPGPDAQTVLDADGNSWKVTEEALTGPEGKLLKRINGFQTYWFAWSQFHPNGTVFQ